MENCVCRELINYEHVEMKSFMATICSPQKCRPSGRIALTGNRGLFNISLTQKQINFPSLDAVHGIKCFFC